MAGSYRHVVDDDGALDLGLGFIENLGDASEALEEMYGMIWWLASPTPKPMHATPGELVELARRNYRAGLDLSPTNS